MLISLHYLSDLGNGWGLAVLDTEEELAFIRESQNNLNNVQNYWIDGSTDRESSRIAQYSQYLSNGSGNAIFGHISMLNF